jgi:hypothetical protein
MDRRKKSLKFCLFIIRDRRRKRKEDIDIDIGTGPCRVEGFDSVAAGRGRCHIGIRNWWAKGPRRQ